MQKILYTSPVLEYPAAGGPQLRVENSIKALSRISELYVVARQAECFIGGKRAVDFYKNICQEFFFAPSVSNLCYNKYYRKIQRVYRRLFSSTLIQDAEFIVSLAQRKNIKVIWFGFGNISYDLIKEVKKISPSLKIVCDTDSVWSRFILRELPYEADSKRIKQIKSDGLKKELEEKEWVNVCDITTAVSTVDAEYYKDLAEDKSKIMLFSNVIDLSKYSMDVDMPSNFISPSIYLAGTFGPRSPMDKAARWFINNIFPLIKKDIQDIHFYIIGNGSKETLCDINESSISILGKVDSVLPYLRSIDVALVPLQFESGTRFKIMEAAACKKPIVSTTLGAEGIPVKDKIEILLADNEIDFANAVIKLIRDKALANFISENCYRLIEKFNSIDSLVLEGNKILKRLE